MFNKSARIFCADDARRLAKRRMPKLMFDFVDGAAGSERANDRNKQAFADTLLQPRVLINVDQPELSKTFLGKSYDLPFGIAPMGMCNLTWPKTDEIMSRECAARNIPHGVSTAASTRLEDSITQSDGKAWFQLYVGQSADTSFDIVKRAEVAGYDTLVLTVDVPHLSRRIRDLRNGFKVPFSLGPKQFFDFALHPRWSLTTLAVGAPKPMNFAPATGNSKSKSNFIRGESRAKTDWAFLERLRDKWPGKLIVKGVMQAEDALKAVSAGADAVYVSNHGGRQLDAAPAALDALVKIRAAVGQAYPLIMDGGIQSGDDVVKALASGADFVMLGRAPLMAIGADGAQGLNHYFDSVVDDLKACLAQIGRRRIEDVNGDVLYRA